MLTQLLQANRRFHEPQSKDMAHAPLVSAQCMAADELFVTHVRTSNDELLQRQINACLRVCLHFGSQLHLVCGHIKSETRVLQVHEVAELSRGRGGPQRQPVNKALRAAFFGAWAL